MDEVGGNVKCMEIRNAYNTLIEKSKGV